MRRMLFTVSLHMIVISIAIALSSYGMALHDTGNEGTHADQRINTAKPKIRRYYVAITPIYSMRRAITMRELSQMATNRSLTITKPDTAYITKLLNASSYRVVPEVNRLKLNREQVAIIRMSELRPGFRVLPVDGKSIWDNPGYPLHVEAEKDPSDFALDRSEIVTVVAVGDVMLSRTVYRKMVSKGYNSPFVGVASRLSQADITFGNLETSLSDSFTPLSKGMTFVAPGRATSGLIDAGFDIVSLANNHSTNFGAKALTDTLDILTRSKIAYVGGGKTEAEAKSFRIIDSKGKRFAFLAINSIVGDIPARGASPGTWHIALDPWGKANPNEIEQVAKKIREAKKISDFVVVMSHWGQEYTRSPNPQMRTLAHQMIRAGADLIIGTHPHWVQGIETYRSGFIAYSLGNFVFDQEWSPDTKQGLILEATFYKGRLNNVDVIPVIIEDYHRPRILYGNDGRIIMNNVLAGSTKLP